MLGAALPGGEGQRKAGFEGLLCLDGPPKMLEEEVGSKTGTEELIPQSSSETFGVGQDISLTS